MVLSLNKWGWALLAKAGVATAVFIAYTYHSDIKKVDYNVFEKNAPIAESFYKNPPILGGEWNANDDGMIETYLVNHETKKRIEIMQDMLPSNKTMIETLEKRALDYQEIPLLDLFSVFKNYPKLSQVKSFMEHLPNILFARMTGSGSSILGYFLTKNSAIYAAKIFKKKYKNYWCITSKTI